MKNAAVVLLLLLMVSFAYLHNKTPTPPFEGIRCTDCNFILISVDTLRADRLGCYGYGKNTSPSIDSFCKEATVFENAISQASSTLVSHASIFTSLYPLAHNAEASRRSKLAPEAVTLAETLRSSGYRTASFNGGGQVSSDWGMDQGYETYVSEDMSLRVNFKKAISWIRENKGSKFHLFIHGFDVHEPYYLPGIFYKAVNTEYDLSIEEFETQAPKILKDCIKGGKNTQYCIQKKKENNAYDVVSEVEKAKEDDHRLLFNGADKKKMNALYDDGVAFVDSRFGQFLSELKEMGLMDNTVIVFTSDHGEELGEHGRIALHSHSLFNELIHVPLIVYVPGLKPERIAEHVESVDMWPTVASILGVKPPEYVQGTDYTRQPLDDIAFSEFYYPHAHSKSAIVGVDKCIWVKPTGATQSAFMFDLQGDPGETKSTATYQNQNERFTQLLTAMDKNSQESIKIRDTIFPKQVKANISKKTQDRLKYLGYIN